MTKKKQIKTIFVKQRSNPINHTVFKPNIWFAVVSAFVAFILYANTIKHEYVLDDAGAITGNQFVLEGFKGIPKILNVGMWHFDNVNLGYYRPLSMITFAIENQFFLGNPHVSHFGNVLLYSLTGFFVCMLLMNLFKNIHPFFSFIITLLFISHPIHTEVVANIKSRDEILAFLNLTIALFILVRAYAKQKTDSIYILLSCLFFYLALLSKESAMTGLLLTPLILFFFNPINIKQALIKTIPFFIVLLIFQMHKYQVLGTVTGEIPKDIVNYPYAEAGTKFPSTFMIFFHCIRLIFLPHPLSYDYSYNQIQAQNFSSPLVLLGFIIAAALLYVVVKTFYKKSVLTFGILYFCITLAPALAFVFLRGGIMAERFLYAPSLGFCIAITWLIGYKLQTINFKWEQIKNQLLSLSPYLIIFLLYSFKTITRNPVWHDNITLFSTDVNTASNSCQVRRHYGSELINSGIAEKDPQKKMEWFNKGTAQLKEALRIYPHFGDAFFKLGVAYQTININNDSAIYYYTKAIQEAPGYALSYNNLGILYEGINKQEIASYYYNKAVDVNPYFPDGVRNRDMHREKYGLDIRIFPSSTNLDSLVSKTPSEKRDYAFYFKLGTDYASKGDYANAAKMLEQSVAANPTYVEALVNLANCYGMLKMYSQNIEVLNKVISLYPNHAQAYGNLAVTYELIGNKEKASEYRDKVKELNRQ